MKILTITSHISSNAMPCFQRNKTGFGYMVHDIISAIAAKGNDVDVLVSWYRFKEIFLDGARYIGCTWWKILSNFFLCLPISVIFDLFKTYKVSGHTKIRVFYCWLLTGYYRRVIKAGKYDIVHIHGCGLGYEFWIKLCQTMNQKFLVTLHGLNSFSDTVNLEPAAKQYERDFLYRVVHGEINITVISTGIKRTIEDYFQVKDCPNIHVVLNSFSFPAENQSNGGG